jgi:hypothetical protein
MTDRLLPNPRLPLGWAIGCRDVACLIAANALVGTLERRLLIVAAFESISATLRHKT